MMSSMSSMQGLDSLIFAKAPIGTGEHVRLDESGSLSEEGSMDTSHFNRSLSSLGQGSLRTEQGIHEAGETKELSATS